MRIATWNVNSLGPRWAGSRSGSATPAAWYASKRQAAERRLPHGASPLWAMNATTGRSLNGVAFGHRVGLENVSRMGSDDDHRALA